MRTLLAMIALPFILIGFAAGVVWVGLWSGFTDAERWVFKVARKEKANP